MLKTQTLSSSQEGIWNENAAALELHTLNKTSTQTLKIELQTLNIKLPLKWCFHPDTPKAMLGLGASLNGSQIKEGDDVYFECRVRFVTFPC